MMQFRKGDWVRHKIYGRGQIRDMHHIYPITYKVEFEKGLKNAFEIELTKYPFTYISKEISEESSISSIKQTNSKFVVGETFRHLNSFYGYGTVNEVLFINGRIKYKVDMLDCDKWTDVAIHEENMVKLY